MESGQTIFGDRIRKAASNTVFASALMTAKALFLIILLLAVSRIEVNGQNELTGKSFKGLVGQACKEMTNGGCMIYTYRILNFRADSVVVFYQVKPYCQPKEMEYNYNVMYDKFTKTYTWQASKDTITINGLDDYGLLTLQNSMIVGQDKFTKRLIEFKEEQQ